MKEPQFLSANTKTWTIIAIFRLLINFYVGKFARKTQKGWNITKISTTNSSADAILWASHKKRQTCLTTTVVTSRYTQLQQVCLSKQLSLSSLTNFYFGSVDSDSVNWDTRKARSIFELETWLRESFAFVFCCVLLQFYKCIRVMRTELLKWR